MEIYNYVVGMFATNTYLLEIDNKCLLIDPASKAEKLIEVLKEKELLAVLLTHGHLDHIKACDGLFNKYKMPIYINKDDENLARDKSQGRKFGLDTSAYISSPLMPLKQQEYEIGPFKFECIFTPGHTKGSVCYKFEKEIFTGDTLFHLSCGRTDLDSGSASDLKASLRLLKNIEGDYHIYPGHEDTSTLNYEKLNNPYLQ